jgi:hypothetical protein
MRDVKVLVSRSETLLHATSGLASAVICPLVQGFSLLPITDAPRAELSKQPLSAKDLPASPLSEVSVGLHALALAVSSSAPVAYVSTEDFGGQGDQDAVAWQSGKVVFSPSSNGYNREWPNAAISQALRVIGVASVEGKDEFDSIGLGNHRETHRWATAYAGA